MLTTRRELCTRVMKRCRHVAGEQQHQQKTCASTCAAACDFRGAANDPTLCCQWATVEGAPLQVARPQPLNVKVYRSNHSRSFQQQQYDLMTTWKSAMEESNAILRADTIKRAAKARAKAAAVDDVKECTLPMDMECGCKTKREKEAKDALALAEAEAKRKQKKMEVMHVERKLAAAPRVESVVRDVPVVNSSAPHVQVVNSAVVAVQTSFHRRHLPHDCIAFSSADGRKLFVEALNSSRNFMQIYFPLAEQFITQAEPAYCGLSTLAMCLNALQIDPGRLWKGAWRWFSEELFDCCTSLSVAKEKGISMSEFICLARCNGVMTDAYTANKDLSLEKFRELVKKSCATNNEIIVLNYSRKVLGQTGDGHFSPIGGYHEERDMVLLLDVARFKYPPHWVKLSLVHAAMQQVDSSSGLPRGMVVLKENAHATGPTLVKNMVHSADPSTPVKPAPKVCCSNPTALESARHVLAATSQ